MNDLKEEEKFKQNAVDFVNLMRSIVEEMKNKGIDLDISSRSLEFISSLAQDMNDEDMIKHFINHTYNYWEHIRERSRDFFLKNVKGVMSGISDRNIEIFKKMLKAKDSNGSPALNKENEIMIWEYHESFVRLSIKYIHRCKNLRSNGEYKEKYYRSVYEEGEKKKEIEITDSELKGMIRKWEIKGIM